MHEKKRPRFIMFDGTAGHVAALGITVTRMATKHPSTTCSHIVKANTDEEARVLNVRRSAAECRNLAVLTVVLVTTSDACILYNVGYARACDRAGPRLTS